MTPSLEAQLRRYGTYLADADDAGEFTNDHGTATAPTPRSGRLVLIGALTLFVVILAGLVVRAATQNSSPVIDGPGSEWIRVPDSPLSPRSGASIGWTGDEIVVFGGWTAMCPPGADCMGPEELPYRDGAAYDPIQQRWRPIADAPLPINRTSTVTLNGEIFALAASWANGSNVATPRTLLRYDAPADRWRTYDLPSSAGQGIVATDSTVIVYSTSSNGHPEDVEFDPETETWAEVPDDPVGPSYDRLFVWADQTLVLFAKSSTASSSPTSPTLTQTARLDGRAWTDMLSEGPFHSWWAIPDGSRVVLAQLGCSDGGDSNPFERCVSAGGVLDLETWAWSELPNAPLTGEEGLNVPTGAFNARQVILPTALEGWMFDLTTDTWFVAPGLDDPNTAYTERSFAGTGPYGFAFGGFRLSNESPDGELLDDAWIWRPIPRTTG